MSNDNRKKLARAYMAEHDCNYTTALRAVSLTRILDDPAWTPTDEARHWFATGRLQLFRQRDRASALITQRPGDRGGSHVNSAEHYYRAVATLCEQKGLTPPMRLYFNCIDIPSYADNGHDEVTVRYTDDGDVTLDGAWSLSAQLENRLTAAGADWGVGDRPAVEPPPVQLNAWLVVPIDVVPKPHNLFRDMDSYLAVDWAAEQSAAIDCVRGGRTWGALDREAQFLIVDPIFIHDMHTTSTTVAGDMLGNGQHRTEAMRRQNVDHVLISAIREVTDPPFPYEIAAEKLV